MRTSKTRIKRKAMIQDFKRRYFAMAKLMEMEQTDRNKVALYLFNNIKIQ